MDRLGFFKHALSGLMDAATTVVGMKQAVEQMTEAVDEALSNIQTEMCLHLPSLEAKMYEDPVNTLSELAQMGYTSLEVGAYYGDTIHDQKVGAFRDMVRKAGLKVVAAHLNREFKEEAVESSPEGAVQGAEGVAEAESKVVTEAEADKAEQSDAPKSYPAEQKWWSAALDVAKELGCKRVVMAKVPAFPPEQTAQMAQTYAEYFSRIAQMAGERELEFCYHPAVAELKPVDGASFLDLIATNAVAEEVKFQIDTFEAMQAGVDIYSLLKQYKHRIVSLHLHDRSTVCESGEIDFDAVVKYASQCGISDIIIEVRNFTLPPMNCVERSIQNVLSLASVRL
ncbi:MAG: TIM barrel protein [Alistipes sp.]|nr:TIM barrel protein [Alistipes sp.]